MIMATKNPIIDRKTFSLFPENVLHFQRIVSFQTIRDISGLLPNR